MTFTCDSSSWIKEDLKKVDTVISLGTQLAADVPGGVDKYRLARDGKELTVQNLVEEDSGVFKCKNYKYSLTVARNPECKPEKVTFQEGKEQTLTCGDIFVNPGATSASHAAAAPRVDWLLDDAILLSEEPTEYIAAAAANAKAASPAANSGAADEDETGATSARSTAAETYAVDFRFDPKFTHNGKRLSCVLEYSHWNASFPKPSCGIDKLDVKFEPRIECPEIQYLNENNSRHEAFCEILGNPRPSQESIFWKVKGDSRRFYVKSDDR